MIVNVHQAKTELSKLIQRAEAGEEIVIARNGKPAVRLAPVEPKARRTPAEIVQAFRQLKAEIKDEAPEGWSVVDEFLAEKHLEAAWEAEQVTEEERRSWLQRLEKYEVWPQEIEAFLASRGPRA